jgi:hypothetical protein
VRRWRELVTGQNRRTLFDRPKPTTGCSANGRRRRIYQQLYKHFLFLLPHLILHVCVCLDNTKLSVHFTDVKLICRTASKFVRAVKHLFMCRGLVTNFPTRSGPKKVRLLSFLPSMSVRPVPCL